jgi:hypothetical protein
MPGPTNQRNAIDEHEALVLNAARQTNHMDNAAAYKEITRMIREATGYKQNKLRWLRDRVWQSRRQARR